MLQYTNSELINSESVKDVVTNTKSCKHIVVTNPSKINIDERKRKLYNREEQKSY